MNLFILFKTESCGALLGIKVVSPFGCDISFHITRQVAQQLLHWKTFFQLDSLNYRVPRTRAPLVAGVCEAHALTTARSTPSRVTKQNL